MLMWKASFMNLWVKNINCFNKATFKTLVLFRAYFWLNVARRHDIISSSFIILLSLFCPCVCVCVVFVLRDRNSATLPLYRKDWISCPCRIMCLTFILSQQAISQAKWKHKHSHPKWEQQQQQQHKRVNMLKLCIVIQEMLSVCAFLPVCLLV